MSWVYWGGALFIVLTFVADVWAGVDYRVAANIALLSLALFVSTFTSLYWWRSNWRINRVGRVFLIKGVAFSVVLWQAVLSVWWDADYPFHQQLRFLIYSLGAIAYAAMLVTLWTEQQRDRKGEEVPKPRPDAPPL